MEVSKLFGKHKESSRKLKKAIQKGKKMREKVIELQKKLDSSVAENEKLRQKLAGIEERRKQISDLAKVDIFSQ